MRIRILGSGAGGGFPQWNCNCANCRAVRARAPGFTPRTQSSLAVSADGANWVLLNASPDLREQIAAAPALAPAEGDPVRASPIKAVALTNGDVDHVAGLLNLREAQPFSIYAADRVLQALAANQIFTILQAQLVPRNELHMDEATPLTGAGVDLGLSVRAFPVPGKIALYLEDQNAPNFGTSAGDTLGLEVIETKTGKSFFYIPGCAKIDAPLANRLRGAALVFFDGTLFHENEMIEQGLMGKTGSRMGHVNMSGEDGSMAGFAPLNVARKIYVHINNSNPVLDANSTQRAVVQAAGWEVGADGMEVTL
ncbi:pyrroloquinoline quinone biosynthesis protein PqqB [Methylocystis sp. Sn-Cys]|uniref:pyrroloquinoline quinone biosynthesis protein PqqB n=1 Tax=Methylocystis sp. Sn-Cys TaxID=1701263 RepID=UPI001924B18D|nr:pyrroloquinoline quinone biosynthesis protein PqqB [Methylocystis sp. Sn-Cys]MBL1258793.1 pyrroloquinoline quinone biosynthesis protein PqqB [Methylocystis sp. Sn-Cys]